MNETKVFARLVAPKTERRNWMVPIVWLTDLEGSVTHLERDAFDFASETRTLENAVYVARDAAGQTAAFRDNFSKEIVMVRNGIETIIDPDNAMQILALAAM